MFHRKDDRLQRLNEELLAEDEDFYEEEMEEEYESDELDLDSINRLLSDEDEDEAEEQELFYRNHANSYGAEVRNYANRYGKGSPKVFDYEEFEADEDLEDEEFLYREDYKKAKKNKKKEKKQEKKKGTLGLAILALIELIAIGGILIWWASWVL